MTFGHLFKSTRFGLLGWILIIGLAVCGCGGSGSSSDAGPLDGDNDGGQDGGADGKATYVKPAGYASVTFFVDDTANQTYSSADIEWKGSFIYDPLTNIIEHDPTWAAEVGPYPPLYDDGPIANGGHEMPGATAGDHIFSVEVYIKADDSFETTFQYGAINEFDNWIWEGSNGEFIVPAGSTDRIDATAYYIHAFGTYDMKVTLDTLSLNDAFLPFDPLVDKIYLKGSMNSWDARQLLDNGQKADEAADDGIYTYHHQENLGDHDGLLFAGQHVQFVFMLNGLEYKRIDALSDGVSAWTNCDSPDIWGDVSIIMEPESRGRIKNTTVVVCEGGGSVSVSSVVPPSGSPLGGESVTVYGSGFIEGAQVTFGTEPASDAVLISEGQINCTTPAHESGSVPIRVTNPGGDFGELPNGFDYSTGDNPEILFLQPRIGGIQGGTPVTITGRRFVAGAEVTFGNLAATNVIVSDDQEIACSTPAHLAGKVIVIVTNPGGGSASFPDGFEYIDSSGPLVASVDPASGSTSGGNDVTVYGSGFDSGATLYFDQSLATDIVVNPPGAIMCKPPAHAEGPVNVRVVNSDDQEDTLENGYTYEVPQVDWAALQWPLSMTLDPDEISELVYAQVYEPQVTEAAGCGPGITAQLGYGDQGTSPVDDPGSWSWVDAECNPDCGTCGNNDEYLAAFAISQAGQFSYAYRFSMDTETTWVYAEGIGTVTVRGGGVDLEIWEIQPAFGSVLGNTAITVKGNAFVDGALVALDGEELVTTFVDENTLSAISLAHVMGTVEVKVTNPDDEFVSLPSGYQYLLRGTPNLDRTDEGKIEIETTSQTDWSELFLAGENSQGSNWGSNRADRLYVAFDDNNLYLGIEGWVDYQAGNALIVYIDTDFGTGLGISNMNELTDDSGYEDSPGLDAAVSSICVASSVEGFGAEFAVGTLGMAEIEAVVIDPAVWVIAGLRGLANPADFEWIEGTVVRTSSENNAIEMAIPLASILGQELPPNGAHLAVFARLANHHGEYLSDDTLPLDNPAFPEVVGQVFVFDIR
ncbi:MAG: IPT/TIG domain-containing protein [Deltaproteobacteria bacterium]|nr:IPT/TIG domain-containing protein [Deltaproteobacteria bacterium]